MSRWQGAAGCALTVLVAAACGPADQSAAPVDMARTRPSVIGFPDEPDAWQPDGDMAFVPPEPRRRIDLRAALVEPDVDVVGVAITVDQKRYLLDATRGIYLLGVGDRATRVWNPLDKGIATGPFFDLVPIGRGTFGVAQRNEGYLVDPASGRVARHFCYLPSGESLYGGALPPEGDQVTDALALAPPPKAGGAARIVAQPITFDPVNGKPIASHLAFFDALTGQSLLWLEFSSQLRNDLFHVRAMTWARDRLLLVTDAADDSWGGRVFTVDIEEQYMSPLTWKPWARALGDQRIEAIAYDNVQGSYLIVDGERDELLEMNQEDVY